MMGTKKSLCDAQAFLVVGLFGAKLRVEKPSPGGGRWRACAPDEGAMSGRHPLISHLR